MELITRNIELSEIISSTFLISAHRVWFTEDKAFSNIVCSSKMHKFRFCLQFWQLQDEQVCVYCLIARPLGEGFTPSAFCVSFQTLSQSPELVSSFQP